jgi:hypothetical protein
MRTVHALAIILTAVALIPGGAHVAELPIVAPPFIKPRIAVIISDTGLTSTKAWSDGLVQLGSARQSWREPFALAHFRQATA